MLLPKHTSNEIVKLYKAKHSPTLIGVLKGYSSSTVRRILLRAGQKMRKPGRPKTKAKK